MALMALRSPGEDMVRAQTLEKAAARPHRQDLRPRAMEEQIAAQLTPLQSPLFPHSGGGQIDGVHALAHHQQVGLAICASRGTVAQAAQATPTARTATLVVDMGHRAERTEPSLRSIFSCRQAYSRAYRGLTSTRARPGRAWSKPMSYGAGPAEW